MIDSINEYALGTKVNDYGNLLIPFSQDSYGWAKLSGRQPILISEKYYWAENDTFLEQKCSHFMISAIYGIIYKIAFCYHESDSKKLNDIREKVENFIISSMGSNKEFYDIDDNHKVFLWKTDNGNIVLDLNGNNTEVILTSSIVKNRLKLIFNYFFRN